MENFTSFEFVKLGKLGFEYYRYKNNWYRYFFQLKILDFYSVV